MFQFCISCVGQLFLSLAIVIFPPPAGLPDLFPLVISVFSCAHFLLFTAYFHYCQLAIGGIRDKSASGNVQTVHGKSTKADKTSNFFLSSRATVDNTTKNKGKANKLKLRKKKTDWPLCDIVKSVPLHILFLYNQFAQ